MLHFIIADCIYAGPNSVYNKKINLRRSLSYLPLGLGLYMQLPELSDGRIFNIRPISLRQIRQFVSTTRVVSLEFLHRN